MGLATVEDDNHSEERPTRTDTLERRESPPVQPFCSRSRGPESMPPAGARARRRRCRASRPVGTSEVLLTCAAPAGPSTSTRSASSEASTRSSTGPGATRAPDDGPPPRTKPAPSRPQATRATLSTSHPPPVARRTARRSSRSPRYRAQRIARRSGNPAETTTDRIHHASACHPPARRPPPHAASSDGARRHLPRHRRQVPPGGSPANGGVAVVGSPASGAAVTSHVLPPLEVRRDGSLVAAHTPEHDT
jgi:hypothetical protein